MIKLQVERLNCGVASIVTCTKGDVTVVLLFHSFLHKDSVMLSYNHEFIKGNEKGF